MSFKLTPEFVFKTFEEVTPTFLRERGIKFILTDVDNTLEPYGNAHPGENVKEWLKSLDNYGIKVAIISNNNSKRINLFNEEIKLISYSKAKKPFSKYIRLAMNKMGANAKNCIFLGDQIFTDVLGAHNAGIPAILVLPIKDKKDLFTKLKRFIEKPFIRKYQKSIEKQKQKDDWENL